MIRWKSENGQTYTSELLLNDPCYDFRDVLLRSDSQMYALSYCGQLISTDSAGIVTRFLPKGEYRQLISIASNLVLAVSTTGIYSFDCINHEIQPYFQPEHSITCVGQMEGYLYVFLRMGQ